jgi:hypothetical protein
VDGREACVSSRPPCGVSSDSSRNCRDEIAANRGRNRTKLTALALAVVDLAPVEAGSRHCASLTVPTTPPPLSIEPQSGLLGSSIITPYS